MKMQTLGYVKLTPPMDEEQNLNLYSQRVAKGQKFQHFVGRTSETEADSC